MDIQHKSEGKHGLNALHSNNSTQPIIQLVAAWPRLWSTHVRLLPILLFPDKSNHLAEHKFIAEMVVLYPNGFGLDKTPFETYNNKLSVEFAEGKDGEVVGFGIMGVDDYLAKRREKTVEGQAIAWFDKNLNTM